MKKAVSLLLTLCLCFSLAVMFTSCGSNPKFEYKLSDDGSFYIITSIEITQKTEVLDIPSEYDGKPVKALTSLDKWTPLVKVKNNHNSALTAINIPNSIRFIDGITCNENCSINFGDYSESLVPTSTFDFPEESDYTNLKPYTFYEFSVIITDISWHSYSGTLKFPENVVLVSSNPASPNWVSFENVAFAGKISPYQSGDGSNGWDEVVVPFMDVRACKTVQVPELAAGKGFSKITFTVPSANGSTDYLNETLILSKSVIDVHFSSNGVPKTVNIFWKDPQLVNASFSSNITRQMQEECFKVYVYSENQPSDSNVQYWHYVDGVPTPW